MPLLHQAPVTSRHRLQTHPGQPAQRRVVAAPVCTTRLCYTCVLHDTCLHHKTVLHVCTTPGYRRAARYTAPGCTTRHLSVPHVCTTRHLSAPKSVLRVCTTRHLSVPHAQILTAQLATALMPRHQNKAINDNPFHLRLILQLAGAG